MKAYYALVVVGAWFILFLISALLRISCDRMEKRGDRKFLRKVLVPVSVALSFLSLPVFGLVDRLLCHESKKHDDDLKFVSDALQAQSRGLEALQSFAALYGRCDLRYIDEIDAWIHAELTRRGLDARLIPTTRLY